MSPLCCPAPIKEFSSRRKTIKFSWNIQKAASSDFLLKDFETTNHHSKYNFSNRVCPWITDVPEKCQRWDFSRKNFTFLETCSHVLLKWGWFYSNLTWLLKNLTWLPLYTKLLIKILTCVFLDRFLAMRLWHRVERWYAIIFWKVSKTLSYPKR